ncbi:unannotated protein [freshwater metagenome]|uniref:Unannotated protein n=1 Tax=freshwater metagenome TaxID=449393 RepID=A0A6J7CXK0_9ZZZZ
MIAGGLLAAAALTSSSERPAAAAPPPPVEVMPGLFVNPRDAWGADLPPKYAIQPETPQFLLVHHTDSPNNYGSGGAREVIRTAYAWHTSRTKGWADVCYEFFVDHDGVVWEGRAGALAGPVMADATGGSQGFAQLVCLIGSFTTVDPTPAMIDSLVRVLAWLAIRYGIDTYPDATTSFISRGSQIYRAGTLVTTPTIAGHRDMSYTECPGDHVYSLLTTGLRDRVNLQRFGWMGTPPENGVYHAQRLGRVAP